MTDAAAAQPRPHRPDRPEVGTVLQFRWRKWDGGPHWVNDEVYLGSDRWGDWLGQRAGWRNVRPGRAFPAEHDSVTLLPPTGDFAYTHNAAPHPTRVYIDVAWDVRWDAGVPTGIDMDLDVVRREPAEPYVDREGVLRSPGDVYIEDRDEWDDHRVAYGYPLDLVERLEAVAVDLEHRVRAGEAPFDDATAAHWLSRLAALPPTAPPAPVTFPASESARDHDDSTAADPEDPADAAALGAPGPAA
ncbi:DUF402 domain-containing protein [Microbacterium jejuense]|uniref:DUF402 domain-containing protein n=1 Tax=Microbacterium jejuense TaxID=1263637 RepID=A0ABS7HHB1_9MICO|nr:DUF402 domain-containing protein [Microbacterium jejuense]MBW9092311.1 DUF402 domain-containing protein [Microbacterium jejuense]